MTGKQFVTYIRKRTRTNAATFPDEDILLFANIRLATLSQALMGAEEDTLIMPQSTNLIGASEDHPHGLREYPFPNSVLSRIKYVEAKLDGENFIHLNEFDLNQYERTTDETYIMSRFSNAEGHAAYDINRKALTLYCGEIPSVALGLKLWCNVYPAELNASRIADETTDLSVDPSAITHGFPRELHEIWARGVIIDYKESQEKPIPLTERELSYKTDLAEIVYGLKHGNMDRVVTAQIPAASDRGNNGSNY